MGHGNRPAKELWSYCSAHPLSGAAAGESNGGLGTNLDVSIVGSLTAGILIGAVGASAYYRRRARFHSDVISRRPEGVFVLAMRLSLRRCFCSLRLRRPEVLASHERPHHVQLPSLHVPDLQATNLRRPQRLNCGECKDTGDCGGMLECLENRLHVRQRVSSGLGWRLGFRQGLRPCDRAGLAVTQRDCMGGDPRQARSDVAQSVTAKGGRKLVRKRVASAFLYSAESPTRPQARGTCPTGEGMSRRLKV